MDKWCPLVDIANQLYALTIIQTTVMGNTDITRKDRAEMNVANATNTSPMCKGDKCMFFQREATDYEGKRGWCGLIGEQ